MARKKSGEKADKAEKPVKELNKRQELNNHIVCMRNTVSQTRVQIISRLIHQVKKYKTRKGNDKEQDKAKRKAERLVEEIQALKKVKKDKASLYALQDTNDPGSVLNDPSSSVEERILSRISHHNLIRPKVKIYRDANPNWDKQIPVLLHMTRQKRKKKTDDEQTPEAKTEETNAHISKKFSETKANNSSQLSSNVKGQQRHSKPRQEASPTNSEKKEKTEDIIKPARPLTQNLNKVEGTVTVKLLKDLNDLESDDSEDNRVKKIFSNGNQTAKIRKPKSGFFVGGVDEPEEDSYQFQERRKEPVKSHFNSGPNYQQKSVFRKGKLVTKAPPSNSNFFQKRPGSRFNQPNSYDKNNFSNSIGGRFQSKQFDSLNNSNSDRSYSKQRGSVPTAGAPIQAEKLHPSWEAKKKQQQITAFEGKRVVFDDDD